MNIHPDTPHLQLLVCPFAKDHPEGKGRIRKQDGSRFCLDPENPKEIVRLADCQACRWPTSTTPPPPPRPKVGDVLEDILATRYSATPTAGCDCSGRIAEMNNWGIEGCEANIETIVGWLLEAVAALRTQRQEADEWIEWQLRLPQWAQTVGLRALVREAIRTVATWTPPAEQSTTTPTPQA